MLLAWLECLHTAVAEAAGLSGVGCCSFGAIGAECCSCTAGVWKWDDSLKCVMKCFWVGRRWKAAALSSAGNLPLAIALPTPSAINICVISKGLIYLQYKMYWWCEFSLCWDSLHLLLTSGMIFLSLLWCLCHLTFIAKKSNCWVQTSAYSACHWGSWPLQLHIQCIAAVKIMLVSLISGRGKINFFTLWS